MTALQSAGTAHEAGRAVPDDELRQAADGSLCPSLLSYPWVGQQDAIDCGVAALAMLARYHGLDVSLAVLRQGIYLGPQGATLRQLLQAATTLGFAGRGVHVGTAPMPELTLPAIAHLIGGHYVVLYVHGSDQVVIGDPASCVLVVSARTFRQAWTGHLLMLTPPRTGPANSTAPEIFDDLSPLSKDPAHDASPK